MSPDGYSLDDFYLARPGAHEAQLDLMLDYASNVALYPQFQAYFRNRQPPSAGGLGTQRSVLPAGQEPKPIRRDIPGADVRFCRYVATSRWKRIARKSPTAIRDFIGQNGSGGCLRHAIGVNIEIPGNSKRMSDLLRF